MVDGRPLSKPTPRKRPLSVNSGQSRWRLNFRVARQTLVPLEYGSNYTTFGRWQVADFLVHQSGVSWACACQKRATKSRHLFYPVAFPVVPLVECYSEPLWTAAAERGDLIGEGPRATSSKKRA